LSIDAPAPPSLDGFRRNLTIVYSDLSGSTRLSGLLEPEDFHELRRSLQAEFARIVPRHGGEVARLDGDGALIVFGHEVSHEDTGRRATEAALELHHAAAMLEEGLGRPGLRLRLHTAIHSGLVLLLPGDLVRGRFEMPGEATNLTAHLCKLAAPGEILVSESTLGADRLFFRTGPRRLVLPDGSRSALAIYSVLGRETIESRFAARMRRGSAPFAGRESELTRLEQCVAQCGPDRVVLAAIAGPAGIGKTRLSEVLLSRAVERGARVHRGYCEAYLGARPLQAFGQLLRSLLADEPGLMASGAAALPDHLRGISGEASEALLGLLESGVTGSGAQPGPDALAPGLLALLDRAAARAPLVLCIDDWQWTDDASQQLLAQLVSRMRGPALLLLVTREAHALRGTYDTVVAVPPLSADEAGVAIRGLLETAEPFAVERITRDAGGSPLFIEELCHALRDGHMPGAPSDRNAWLDMLIQARFSRLAGEPAELIQTAAVIGHIIPEWLFEAITGLNADHPSLAALAAVDFLYAGEFAGTLRFKHGITRDAIYRSVGLAKRKTIHRRVVEALDARSARAGEEEPLEMLAYHHGAAGNGDRALHYAMLAGDKAMAASALDRAQAQYRAAFEAVATLTHTPARKRQTIGLVRKFGLSCIVDPSPEQVRVLEAMAEHAGATDNDEALALAQYWLGATWYGLGDPRRSIRHLEQATASAAPLGNADLHAQLQASLGRSYVAASEYPVGGELLDGAIARLRARRTRGIATGLAYSLSCRGLLFADQGCFDRARADFAEVEAILGDAEVPMRGSYYTQIAATALWQGEYDEAIEYGTHGVRLSQHTRTRYISVMSEALAAYGRWCRDRDPAAVGALLQAAGWFRSGASRQRVSLCFGWLAEALAASGRPDEARFYASQAFRRARVGDRLGEAMAARAMARVAAQGHGHRSAEHYLALAWASADARCSAHERAQNRLCEAELALAGDPSHAAELAAAASASFAALGMAFHRTAADTLIPLTASR